MYHPKHLTTEQAGIFTEADLLGPDISPDEDGLRVDTHDHAVVTAPVFTGDVLDALGTNSFPQRALYGRVVAQHGAGMAKRADDSRLFINTNAPFSALVCGVQGSGKSHSTSVLLESVLIQDDRLGQLPEPLSAIVFHLDSAAGGGMVQPCEAAYLASIDRLRGGTIRAPPVTVLVLPNNLRSMRAVYAGLPGVRVEPLHFASGDISGERLLAMMKVDESTQIPLYMEAIMNILRQMNDQFDYAVFRQQLATQKFNPGQKAMLNLRLALLDSCLEGGSPENSVTTHFRKGQLTVVDLSSPFMDGSSACGFFDIILGLFVEADIRGSGKLVLLDEAHKYLSDQGSSSRLTDSLLTVIRQQRHLATRVVISTQEPTVVPEKFIDLCSFVIAHRFSSPTWLKHLLQHISASGTSSEELWNRILSLNTGHAIMFSPNGLGMKIADEDDAKPCSVVSTLGQGYLVVRSRLRVTRDGGHSLLAVQDPHHSTRLGRVHGPESGNADVVTSPALQPTYSSAPSIILPSADPVMAKPFCPSNPSRTATLNSPAGFTFGQSNGTSYSPGGTHRTSPPITSVHHDTDRFTPLMDAMRSRKSHGMVLVPVKSLGTSFTNQFSHLIPTTLRDYLRDAETAGLIAFVDRKSICLSEDRASLVPVTRIRAPIAIRSPLNQHAPAFTMPAPSRMATTSSAPPSDDVSSRLEHLSVSSSLSRETQALDPSSASRNEHVPVDDVRSLQEADAREDSDSDSDNDEFPVPLNTTNSVGLPLSAGTAPTSAQPILRLLAQTHSHGYSRVAYTYIAKQLGGGRKAFRYKGELQASISAGITSGHIILTSDVGGRYFSLPSDSPLRRPIQIRLPHPVGPGGAEFAPLLQFLRGSSPAKRKQVRKHLKNRLPDAPYGQTASRINHALDRACELGLVTAGGTGKKAWLSLK